MKLYLVRHGITDWNARKKIQGQVDMIAQGQAGFRQIVCGIAQAGCGLEEAQGHFRNPALQKAAVFGNGAGLYPGGHGPVKVRREP